VKARRLLVLPATLLACSIGQGSGTNSVVGELDAPECWKGVFDLQPDYFAAVPFELGDSLMIKIQRGGDYQNFSDGIFLGLEHLRDTRARIAASGSATFKVSLPPEVTPPGIPVAYDPDPARVHMTLYLQRSCRTQNPTLHTLEDVDLGPSGECPRCDGYASSDKVGRSTVTFQSLFSGNPDEVRAAERLTKGSFTVYLADPRETCPGAPRTTRPDVGDDAGPGGGVSARPPPPCRGWLRGEFEFYFQRGKPAQPFP